MNHENSIARIKNEMGKLPENERVKIEDAAKTIVESYEGDVKPIRKQKRVVMGTIAFLLFGIVYNFTTFYNGFDLSPLVWCLTGFNIALLLYMLWQYKCISWQLDEMQMCYEISKELKTKEATNGSDC